MNMIFDNKVLEVQSGDYTEYSIKSDQIVKAISVATSINAEGAQLVQVQLLNGKRDFSQVFTTKTDC